MNRDGASPQGLASAHLCTVKSGRDDTFVMCHPVLKLLKTQHGRETLSFPQVTKASLPLMDQLHRQETTSSVPHTQKHTCSPLP